MKAGFAVGDITPGLGIYLTGYGLPERLADSIHSPLTVTAMVLEEEDRRAVVLGVDWCYCENNVCDRIRREIGAAVGIPMEQVLFCCAHTHSAPHTSHGRTTGRTTVDPEGKGVEYAVASIPVFIDTVRRARSSVREVEIGIASTLSDTGVSRRAADEEGEVRGFLADPDLVCDRNLTAIHFRDRGNGESVGIMIHLGCHNTCMGHARAISSDWCGVMRERIRDRYPVPVLYLNGALGDVGPRTSFFVEKAGGIRGFSAGAGDGAKSVVEVGNRAAADALRALDSIREFRAAGPLRIRVFTQKLPQGISRSESEAREMLERYAPGSTLKQAEIYYAVAQAALKAWSEPPQPVLEFDQPLIAFGPVALAPFPFEVFSVFSLRLRKFGAFAFSLLCSDANGYIAYLPDRGAVAQGGYEVTWRERQRPYVTLPEAGDVAISAVLKELREMAAQQD